jgi:hypothetical protein
MKSQIAKEIKNITLQDALNDLEKLDKIKNYSYNKITKYNYGNKFLDYFFLNID